MAWSWLQSNSVAATASSGTSQSVAFTTANLSSGSTVIAAVAIAAGTSSAPTTPTATCGGTSMVLISQVTSGTAGVAVLTALFALNTPAGQAGTKPTVQASWTNTGQASLLIQEVAGIVTAASQAAFTDGTPATKATTSAASPATCNAYSSTASNEYLVAVYGDDGGPATLGALSTGYSVDGANVSANSHADIGVGWKNSGNGAETMSWALSVTIPNYATILVAFQLAPSGPGSSMLPQPGGQTWRRQFRRHQPWPATANTPVTGTAATTLNMTMAGTGYQSLPFPVVPLGMKIELLINGTWTDVSKYVYQRADMVITLGRPNESQQLQQGTCTFTLNNRDGRFSPYNTSGAYSPFLTRNTQCRVSVTALSAGGILYSGYRFWGEVPAWPPQWDTSATDVTAVITVSGIMRRLTANTRNIGSALYRYYTRLGGAAAPVAYWPGTDATSATSFASAVSGGTAMTWTGSPSLASDSSIPGSDPFAKYSGSVWTGSVSGGGPLPSPATYSTPGTYLWQCPGDVTSLTSAEMWGAGGGSGSGDGMAGGGFPTGFGGGGGGAYSKIVTVAVTPGTQYSLTVGSGGIPGTSNGNGGDGNDSFATFDAATVRAKAGTATKGGTVGQGGSSSGSTGTTKHGGGNGGSVPFGNAGGAGGGSSGGTGSSGNNGANSPGGTGGSGGSAVSGGGAGGAGSAQNVAGMIAPTPGGGAGGAGAGGSTGGTGGAGKAVLTYVTSGAPAANVLTFCLDVPSAGGVNGAIYAEMLTSGTIATVDVTYGTGGTLTVTGYNAGHVSKFTHTSGAICNGVPMAVRVTLTQSGSAVAWSFDYITPGGAATNISSGSVASSTIGGAEAFNGNPGGTETGGIGVGEVVIQYAVDPLSNLSTPLAGYAGERAAARLLRLCQEANVGFELTGNASDTAQMGPQTDTTIVALFQECEDVDKGLLYEPRDMFGVGYRTRVSLQNQSAGATLDYAAFEVGEAIPQPTNDELLVVNDMTFTRPNGSSYESTVMTGALSVNTPPNGVGYYSQAQTFNFFADSQLANATTWATTIGTVDEFRWPVITADLRRSELSDAEFSNIANLFIGGFLKMINPPSFVLGSAVNQLVYGYTETLNAFNWTFDFNCVPESPYTGAGLPTW